MKFKLNLVLLFVLLILLFPGILATLIPYRADYEQPPTAYAIKVNQSIILEQSFKASKNRLSVIGISVRNPSLINKKDLILMVVDQNDQVIRESVVNGGVIDDGAFLKIKFKPIEDSMNQIYRLRFSSPESWYAETLEIKVTQKARVDYGQLLNDGKISAEWIAFVPFYTPENRLVMVFDIYQSLMGRLMQDQGFLVGYLLILGGVMGYLVRTLRQ